MQQPSGGLVEPLLLSEPTAGSTAEAADGAASGVDRGQFPMEES